jgi:Metallopeptidase toxin 3
MFLDHDDEKKYPKCKALMMGIEGSLKHEPDVLKAFLTVCNASSQPTSAKDVERVAREKALRYGVGPRIKVHEGVLMGIVQNTPGGKRTVVEACAVNDTITAVLRKTPVVIEVISAYFDAFEFGYYPGDPFRPGRRLTITLLHELVHWVRGQTKASDDAEVPGFIPGEAGELFEKIAFGGSDLCNDDEIFDAITSFRKRPF